MNADIFQAALAATARVACCAALVSCQKPVNTPEAPPLMEHASQKEEKPVVKQVPDEPKRSEVSTEFTACDQTIQEFLKIEPIADQNPSKEVLACCSLQGNEVDQKPDIRWDNRIECCEMLNWRGPRGCTPWGPPTPPHMV
ncbi:MAG: hypothetical protein CL916_03845 [Deltaproteobacteria bacterium]|nr:hypothetical protein [Deltaproteobacteria bacterium]